MTATNLLYTVYKLILEYVRLISCKSVELTGLKVVAVKSKTVAAEMAMVKICGLVCH